MPLRATTTSKRPDEHVITGEGTELGGVHVKQRHHIGRF
jgi:hypothetical protein